MSDDPRETLNEVLKNLHGSLKWYWQVVMGLAMVKAIDNLYTHLYETKSSFEENLTYLIFFCAFLLVFIRFYFGDSRYLDEHYIEHRKWQPIDKYLMDISNKISKKRIILDIFLLVIIGIFFVFMAKSLFYPNRFFMAYCFLLLFNVIWLKLTISMNSDYQTPLITSRDRYRAPDFWVGNNLIHLLFMFFLLLYNVAPKPVYMGILSLNQILLLLLCISNSIFDLLHTSNYYFPKLNAELNRNLRE